MIFHLYIANIFLLNYLIAILSSVYGEMGEKGLFYYKLYKYKYIERYAVAFKDTDGYSELIIHPPPINLFLVFLLPFLWRKDKLKKYAHLFSKINFWAENCIMIAYHFMYELYMMPIVYFGILNSLWQVSGIMDLHLILGWILFGPFYVIYGLGFDMI